MQFADKLLRIVVFLEIKGAQSIEHTVAHSLLSFKVQHSCLSQDVFVDRDKG